MANIFKQNTRFEALNESNNNGNNRRDNSFSERRVRSEGGRSSDSRRQNNSAQSFKTQADVAAKEQAAKLELSEDNFPTLAAVAPSTAAQANYGSFSQCVKTVIKTETPELPAGLYAPGAWAYDMMYGAKPTAFMLQAKKEGASQISDGLGMLVGQAAESFFLWHGKRPDVQPVLATLRAELNRS